MSAKRILMLNYEFPPLGGGGGIAAKKLAEGFIELGYEVDYVTTWFDGLERFEVVDGINVHRVSVIGRKELPTATMLSLVSFPFLAYRQVKKLCKIHRYEFINTHFALPTGPLGIWTSKKFGLKNILSLHGGDIYDPTKQQSPHRKWYFRAVVNWVLRNSDRIVAQSSNTRQNTEKYYRVEKLIEIIPLPYKPFVFQKVSRKALGLDESAFYTVSVGRLVARKGFDFLIRSLARVEARNVHALIIGDGPEKTRLQALADTLGMSDRVHLLGALDERKKFQYLAVADVYVLSSVHEGFAIVLQEAMQVGLPIIATNEGGQVDFIDSSNEILVRYGDDESLARAISAYSSGSFVSPMSAAHLAERFSVLNVASAYLRIV